MLTRVIRKLVDIHDADEIRGLLIATAYGFFIMFSYYILRAVRDEISSADRGNLQILWTAVFLVMLVAVPLYSWVASRWSRGVFVPLANRFFIACLIGFWLALAFLPETARPWIDRVFYVWTSVFALFVVTVFWGFLSDCFDNSQAKRLFAFIAVGSSIGGMAGSTVTAVLAELVEAVYTIEIIEALGTRARGHLEALGYENITVRIGDGYYGWEEQAPFDAVLITAAPPQIPEPLKQQLKVGGRLVVPVGKHVQDLVIVTRTKSGFKQRTVLPVRFVPMTGEAEKRER